MEESAPSATRKDLQFGRRFFHMASGMAIVMAYGFFLSHAQMVRLLGTIACIAYLFDRVRVAYPEIAKKVEWVTNFFLRAEERLKESSMIPFVMGILLTLLIFPKPIALVAISILALADPFSAMIGIQYGTHHWVKEKTIEGSTAFFVIAFLCTFLILIRSSPAAWWIILGVSLLLCVAVTALEMLPIKLDDNLTIPLFAGFVGWAFCLLFGVPLFG